LIATVVLPVPPLPLATATTTTGSQSRAQVPSEQGGESQRSVRPQQVVPEVRPVPILIPAATERMRFILAPHSGQRAGLSISSTVRSNSTVLPHVLH